MIYCCGGYHKPFKSVFLLPDFMFRGRKLEVLLCPNCGVLVAVEQSTKSAHHRID